MAGNDLVISVGASIRDLERQMKAAAQVAEQRADEIEDAFKRRNPSFAGDFGMGLLKGAIAAISFEKIISGLAAANREIASFADTARKAGIEVERFQTLRLAAARGGVDGKSFDGGLEGIAKALNNIRLGETELTKLLDANGVKYRDRLGTVVSTNEALGIAADLISRAASEQDKIAIAEKFGLPKDFLPLLEGGADALNRLAKEAAEAGYILDAEVVAKAKQFDDAWGAAWTTFTANAKAAVTQAGTALADLVRKAQDYQQALAKGAAAGAKMGQLINDLSNGGQPTIAPLPPARPEGTPATAPLPPSRPGRGYIGSNSTRIPAKSEGGGGGKSSGKSDEEAAQDRLERYIETLMRQNSVLDAEISTFGKSNAEKRAAVELAKAQVDLAKLDEGERQKIISSLTKEIELSEQKRTKLESLKSAQQGLTDAQKYFGNAAVDALEDLIINGAKAEDVVRRLAASLAKAALQALLIGDGPLAGIFGTKGIGGSAGGLFGMLGTSIFGRATGGSVNAGQVYDVGERGKERFVPTVPGKIVPAGRGGAISYTDGRVINITPANGVTPEQMTAALAAYDRQFRRNIASTLQVAAARY